MNNWKGKNDVLLIAEIGGNHEGNFEYAKKLTQLAIESNVDFIKYQIYTGDTLVSKLESPKRNSHFKKFELTNQQYIELAKMCHKNNVKFMASVWNLDSISWIDEYMEIYKIGSGDLTAYPVIEQTCKIGKPIILSTGLSTLKEVKDTVDFIRKVNSKYHNKNMLALLQCTSMYPIPFSDANLNTLESLKEISGCEVGYSDHTEGSYALEIAVAKGAKILEFHFTDSREDKSFRDHKVSLTKSEVLELIQKIKDIKSLEGDPVKKPLPVEGDHIKTFRRALYPKKDLPEGTILKGSDLIALRPNSGIDARDYQKIIGKKLLKGVKKHEKLDYKILK